MSARRWAALAVLFLPVLLTAGLGAGAGYALSRAIRIPKVSELATYRPDIITELRGVDGSVIARFAIERRMLVERPDIPDVMVKALLAAEDARFFDHSGIDLIRIGGAAMRDLATRRMSHAGHSCRMRCPISSASPAESSRWRRRMVGVTRCAAKSGDSSREFFRQR